MTAASAPVTPAVARARLRAQQLSGEPAADPPEAVTRLLAVQGQDPRGFRLAVRARSVTPSAREVDRCLTVDRSLVVDWLCRGTLHLVGADDHAWLHALTSPSLRTGTRRRLAQEGVSADQAELGVRVVERAVRDDGPQSRAALRARLDAAGVPTAGQALVHVLVAASIEGRLLRGPVVAGEQAFVHPEDWLGPRPSVDRDTALAELARRYLAGHAPASDRDLAAWAGLPLRDARRAITRAGASLRERPDGLLVLRGTDPGDLPETPARLLGSFDPVLHGWASREWVVGEAGRGIVTSNGLFRPFALVRGRAVALWRYDGARAAVIRDPLPGVRVSQADLAALDTDAARVAAYLS